MNQHNNLTNYIKAITQHHTKGLIVKGEPGIGKSHTVISTLNEQHLKQGKHYEIIRGHITPMTLFKWMSEHRNKILIFDDVSGLFDSPTSIGLLKNGLDTTSNKVTYMTSSHFGIEEPTFEFTGSIVILTNDKTIYGDACEAIRSRCIIHEMKLTYIEKLRLIRNILERNQLSENEVTTIMQFIVERASPTAELDIRTTHKLLAIYKLAKADRSINFAQLADPIIPQPQNNEEQKQHYIYKTFIASKEKTVTKIYKEYSKNPEVIKLFANKIPAPSSFYRHLSKLQEQLGNVDKETYKEQLLEIAGVQA